MIDTASATVIVGIFSFTVDVDVVGVGADRDGFVPDTDLTYPPNA